MKLKNIYSKILSESISDILKDLSRLDDYKDFEKRIVSLPNDTKHSILDYIKDINKNSTCGSGIPLYHGTESKIAVDILDNGFKIGKGRRSGFMGSENIVDNLGIFLTDSKKAASFFGNNRSERGDFVVIKTCANLNRVLDLSSIDKMPIEIKKTGLTIINDYEGSSKTKLAGRDIWWLLDKKDFVEKIKELGYDSVKFKEASNIVKMIDDPNAFTYMVFNPSDLKINKNVNTLQDLFSFLKNS